ncbi:cyclin-dependent kinase A-2-like [Rhododendron vialii]|uniref:cyclin-dependent kinase A-2-like n=1 Tax=Rhododendron vialii TaxID=182163 RepID=UPI00265EF490|nr:cyclin-dependent kinase A-2-like [Rhododendron vialii]
MALEYVPMNLDSHMDLVNYSHKYPDITRILLGIAYYHENKVLHGDLKSENLLVDPKNDTVKICDFGLAKSFVCPSSSALTAQVATLRYRASEVLMDFTEYTIAIDMWVIFSKLEWLSEESWPHVTLLPSNPHPNLPLEEPPMPFHYPYIVVLTIGCNGGNRFKSGMILVNLFSSAHGLETVNLRNCCTFTILFNCLSMYVMVKDWKPEDDD